MVATCHARACRLVLLALVVALGPIGSRGTQPSGGHAGVAAWGHQPEPTAAAAYIASQRDRDTVAASQVMSPLYHAEMARRGRGDEWPLDGLWAEATSRLDFTFVAALSDASGITYTLYTARAKQPISASPTSLWRIDLDPEDQVIWAELARIFDGPQVALVPEPRVSSAGPLRPLLAVRSSAGDAYVAVDPDPAAPGRVAFAQEDASGALSPSYWSFGEPLPTRDAQSHPVDSRPFDVGALGHDQVQTLHSYLVDVDWSPADAVSAG